MGGTWGDVVQTQVVYLQTMTINSLTVSVNMLCDGLLKELSISLHKFAPSPNWRGTPPLLKTHLDQIKPLGVRSHCYCTSRQKVAYGAGAVATLPHCDHLPTVMRRRCQAGANSNKVANTAAGLLVRVTGSLSNSQGSQ